MSNDYFYFCVNLHLVPVVSHSGRRSLMTCHAWLQIDRQRLCTRFVIADHRSDNAVAITRALKRQCHLI